MTTYQHALYTAMGYATGWADAMNGGSPGVSGFDRAAFASAFADSQFGIGQPTGQAIPPVHEAHARFMDHGTVWPSVTEW